MSASRGARRLSIRLLAALGLACSSCASLEGGGDFHQKVLAATRSLPGGGGYDGSDATKNLLAQACRWDEGVLKVAARQARPSFCSGATYLVLLKALESGPPELLPERDQQDGHGVFGRWNANGPGSAKLITDLRAGENFTSWARAKPGDFLKIWWTDEIGGRERGHLVVYLGHDAEQVRFWSSNQPAGYGVKSVPRRACRRVLFTRITRPERFAAVGRLPRVDPWLQRMLKEDFSWAEVARVCQVKEE